MLLIDAIDLETKYASAPSQGGVFIAAWTQVLMISDSVKYKFNHMNKDKETNINHKIKLGDIVIPWLRNDATSSNGEMKDLLINTITSLQIIFVLKKLSA